VPPTKLAALAVAAALVVGCSGGDDDDAGSTTTTTQAPRPTVDLEVLRADLVSPHAALGPLDATTTEDVVNVVEKLLLVASAGPLVAGTPGGGFGELFTAQAAARAEGADRDAFFDEGVPSFGRRLRPAASPIELTGLAGSTDPAPAVVVARFVWDVGSTSPAGNRVARSGELSLLPVGGGWRIAAYSVTVQRTVDAVTTTTTAELDE
jgi:hypothetical protein